MIATDGPSESVLSDDAARQLLVDLVSLPSPSGEEAACADHLVGFFEAHGRDAWTDAAGNVRVPGDDGVLLTSHLDTVPGAVPVRVAEGILWGRGSVDAKGSLAAMAVAAVRTGASFAGVVCEETDSAGAAHLVRDREPPAAVINGEPSGADGITLGYRGLVKGSYHAATPAVHGAAPGPNAIELATAWFDGLGAVLPDGKGAVDTASVTPTSIQGGLSADGTAMEATVGFACRVPPGTRPSDLTARIESSLEAGSVTWGRAIDPVVTDPRSPVAAALRAAIRSAGLTPRPLHKTGTSDMNVYAAAWDVPMATYGPGDAALDHTPDERLPLEEYSLATAVLETASERLLRRDYP